MRKTPLKRKPLAKKPKASTLLTKADNLCREYCKATFIECPAWNWPINGKTHRCSERVEWCHVKSRGNKTIRHHPDNWVGLCSHHHAIFTMHPDLWREFIEEINPGAWQRLNEILQEGKKPDYAKWINYYREKLNELEAA